jgi:hypothetical protein
VAALYVNNFFNTEERRLLLWRLLQDRNWVERAIFVPRLSGELIRKGKGLRTLNTMGDERLCALQYPSQFDADVFSKLSCLCKFILLCGTDAMLLSMFCQNGKALVR